MKRREFFIAGAAAAAMPLVTGSGCSTGQARPNVLFICTDQFNSRTAGFAGHPLVYTPHLDRLARRGTVFTNCYSNSPVCVPARASLFTGLFAHEVEAYDNAAPFDGRVPCWTNRLAQSGYLCRATGKLDFVAGRDYGLLEVDTEHGHDTNPDITAYFRNPLVPRIDSRVQIEGFVDEQPSGDERCVAEAMGFLGEDAPGLGGRPWLEYVGLTSPHPPWRVPRRYFDMYPLDNISLPEIPGGRPPALHPCLMAVNHYNRFDVASIPEGNILRARAAYYGSISRLDEWVGQILDELEKTGRAGNTVVVFTADHGEMLGEHGMWFKGCPYDQAARVPLVIAGPGFTAGRKVEVPVSHVDLAATLTDLAGIAPADGLRGRSLLPLAAGTETGADRWAYGELNSEGNVTGVFWIRRGRWKYVYFVGWEPLLFDLDDDPGEFVNLAADPGQADIVKELDGVLRELVDPEDVSRAAFTHQRRRLDADLARLDDPEVYRRYARRLGEEFARKLKAGGGRV